MFWHNYSPGLGFLSLSAIFSELLLKKGYIVHGIKRRASSFNTQRIDHLYQDPHTKKNNFHLHYGDLTDSTNIIKIIQKIKPDEIYNLGAQSHVSVSFESPEYTANSDALGTLRILEAVRLLGMQKKTKIYQASTSELYGLVQEIPQSETTPFYPRSPYAVAKLYAYWITVNYRESYGMFACNGILFNHESPRRGETFVTRKITRGLSRINQGLDDCLYLGNLDALRDWGHARDYVLMQWSMLQKDEYPNSNRIYECEKLVDELRDKLAKKDYETARLYLKLEKYDSAVIYFNQVINEFYDTIFYEKSHIGVLLSYQLSENDSLFSSYYKQNINQITLPENLKIAKQLNDGSINKFQQIKLLYR